MKVYAEFFEDEGQVFRTKALLQFGDSWELIGSIVMKNPGGSEPKAKLSSEVLNQISNFYQKEVNENNWFEANKDNTMTQIGNIFSGKYIGKDIKLNGVIQIFNLFNLREKNLENAKKMAMSCNSKHLYPSISETIQLIQSKPTYLGFYWEYVKKPNDTSEFKLNVNKFATEIFEFIKDSDFMYLNSSMIDNAFYHPLSRCIKGMSYHCVLKKFVDLYEIS